MGKMKATEKQILFARKIKALAEQGEAGEKQSATRALQNYLSKNGLTMEDIAEVPMQRYGISTTKDNLQFISQVIASVIGQPHERGRWLKGRTLLFNSTHAEYIEIKDRINHFLKAYKEEQDIFYSAFIQKNHLYAKENPNAEDEDEKPLTPEEKRRLWKVLQMAEGITTETYYKKLY